MLDIPGLIDRGVQQGGDAKPILAAPFDLTPAIYESYILDGKIAGVIVNGDGSTGCALEPNSVGHWVDRQAGRLSIDSRASRQMLFLGTIHQISGHMLLEMLRKGIRELICLTSSGIEFQVIAVRKTLNSKALQHIGRRMTTLPVVGEMISSRLHSQGINFQNAFRDLRENGHFLSLPREAFHENKILIVSGSLGPGGAERQIHYTARGLAGSENLSVSVACSYLEPPGDFFKAGIEDAGVRVLPIPIDRKEFSDPEVAELITSLEKYNPLGFQNVARQVLASIFVLRDERPSIVHLWMDATNICTGIAAQIVGVPCIVLSGRSVAPDNFEIHQPYMHPGYLDMLAHGSPTFLNNSNAGAIDYARWLDIAPDRIQVLHNGMEFPTKPNKQQIAEFRKSHNLSAQTLTLGGILRFSEEKRPQLWIDTAAEVVKAHPGAMAIGFGGGVMHKQMQDYVRKLGLQDKILLPGVTNNAWLAAASMDVFLMTSRKEGFPNVLLEAQGMGVPIVCTATGGMPETYIEGKTGISVPEATPRALARECLKLFADKKRLRSMGQLAYEHVRKVYSVQQMIDETLAAYQNCIR